MSFFERLKTAASAEWRAYTEHPFTNGLADGSLAEAAFRHYLVQDYLFLIEFARAYALSVYKSPKLADMREATAGLSDLRRAVESKRFEAAREAAIFLSIVFDSKICRAVAPLLDAIPRFSTLLDGPGNSHQARWIATKADFQTLTRLLDSLRLKSEKRPKSGV